MKVITITSSDIASHPFQSATPEDYICDEEHVKRLLSRFSKRDQQVLVWMVKTGKVSEKTMFRYIGELNDQVRKRAENSVSRLIRNFNTLERELGKL